MRESVIQPSIAELVGQIADLRLQHPVRIGVDGRTGSGKTTFSNRLAEAFSAAGRQALRASIDDFHRPAAERRRKGRYSAEGYYRDARDLEAFVTLLLKPLGPGGSLRFARRSFDLLKDRPVEPEFKLSTGDAVFIIDGTFLQRSELRGLFDIVIFLDVPEVVARRRALTRDAALVGSADEAARLYDLRYGPAFRSYEAENDPRGRADIIVQGS